MLVEKSWVQSGEPRGRPESISLDSPDPSPVLSDDLMGQFPGAQPFRPVGEGLVPSRPASSERRHAAGDKPPPYWNSEPLGPEDARPESWRIPAGWQLSYRALTASTNDEARQGASRGSGGPVVFLADDQWAGRGRYGRRWVAPAGSSLLLSILVRTALEPILETAVCSVAVAEVLQETVGLAARIKWPNDVMVGERKICGVLTEVVGAAPAGTIVGIGLNVNMALDTPGLPSTATSISAELGRPFSRQILFERILARVDWALALDPGELAPALWARWEALLWRRMQSVRVADGGQEWEGIVEGLSPSGGLWLRDAKGARVELTTAELLV